MQHDLKNRESISSNNQKMDINRLKTLSMPALLLAVTFGICGPLQMYLTNMQELWFSIGDIWWMCLLCGIVIFAVCIGIGLILPRKIVRYYSAVIFGIALGMYIQGNFVPTDYGILDGREIDWAAYQGTAVINTLIWAGCILIPILLTWKKAAWAKSLLSLGAAAVTAMQVTALVILLATNQFGVNETEGYLSNRDLDKVSSDENVVIFVLDTFDQEYFDAIYESEPEFLEPLDGFTYFSNATGMYSTTKGSLPYIMTGQIYRNEQPHPEFIKQAFETIDTYHKLKEAGFEIILYTDRRYVYDSADSPLISNYERTELEPSSDVGLFSTLQKFTMFRYFPHLLKKYVWLYSGEFDQWKQSINAEENLLPSQYDNVVYYDTLRENGLQVVDDRKMYKLIHLEGVHLPYTLNRNVERVTDNSATAYSTSIASLKVVYEYIAQCKELGVYDNTTFIIMADHGAVCGSPTSPMLLVKRQGERGELKINNAPVCQADIIPTIMEDVNLGDSDQYGRTLYEFAEGEERDRRYFYYNLDWGENDEYLPNMVEYRVDPESNDTDAYHLINYPVSDYKLGELISFADSQTSHTYCITGFSISEGIYTWTSSPKAKMAFKIDAFSSDALKVQMNIAQIFNQPQKMIVSVGDNVVYDGTLTQPGTVEFGIRKEYVQDGVLELDFQFPDAISPYELGISGDIRTLAVGFADMTIEEADLTDLELAAMAYGVPMYELGTVVKFNASENPADVFTAGLSQPEENYAWSLGTEGEIKLAVGEVSAPLDAEMGVVDTIDNNQIISISAQGETLYEAALPTGASKIQFGIPKEAVVDGILTLELSYPNAVSPQSINPDSTDTRVLSVRFSDMVITAQSENEQ